MGEDIAGEINKHKRLTGTYRYSYIKDNVSGSNGGGGYVKYPVQNREVRTEEEPVYNPNYDPTAVDNYNLMTPSN